MSTNVVPFDRGAPPAVFAGRRSSLIAAAKAGVQESFAVLGIRGKNWRIKYRGEEHLVKGDDDMPMQMLPVVVVGISPNISKQWYETGYTEGSDAPPDCFSVNGTSPDPSAPKKQCATCVVCPKNVFGSRITPEGKKAKACADSRRIAVVPLGDIENEMWGGPMMLRLPAATLTNLKRYAEMVEHKGATLEAVATGLSFDFEAAYPRVVFRALGWLDEEQALAVVGPDGNSGMCAHPALERMLQEPVDEVSSDPKQPAPEANPLDQGAPAATFQQRAVPRQVPLPMSMSHAPVGTEVHYAPAIHVEPAVQQAHLVAAALQKAHQAPARPPVAVTAAPDDMAATIDDLLRAPV